MTETIFGITGKIGAGKDTVGNYLEEEYGFEKLSYGDAAREIGREEGIELTRENLQKIGKERTEEIHRRVNTIIDEGNERDYALTGVREPWQAKDLRNSFEESFYLLHVKASQEKRFERLKKRGSERDPSCLKDFLEQDLEDKKIHNLQETLKQSDFEIENDGSMEYLRKQIDEIVESI